MYRREEPLTIAKAGSDVIKANVVVTLIASVWVFLRLCSRRMRKVEFQLEDYMILGALVSFDFNQFAEPGSPTNLLFHSIVLSLRHSGINDFRQAEVFQATYTFLTLSSGC
jgi:hypothetical protein